MKKKFLVIQTAFIGDAILATGLLEKLKATYPDAEIDYLVRKGNESLFVAHPFLNELLIWDKQSGKYRDLLRLLKKIRKRRYDYVINLQRFAATGFLTVFSFARETIGFDKNPWSVFFSRRVKHEIGTRENPVHEIERNNRLIEHLCGNKPGRPALHLPTSILESVQDLQKEDYICIAPASVWFTKQYPKEKWADFVKSLPGNQKVYFLGAPQDAGLIDEIIGVDQGKNLVNMAGKLSLLQSAALMKGANMNFVNDSAPMHLASATNAPVTAIYCSTVPWFGFGPLSDTRFIVETSEPPSCKPCGLHGYASCPKQHFSCALTIRNEQLLACLPDQNG
jgi:heptosyltransferase-2